MTPVYAVTYKRAFFCSFPRPGGIGLPLQCLSLGTFQQQLAFTMIAPIVVAAVILLGFVMRACFRGKDVRAAPLKALPGLLSLSFLAFPVVSSYAFLAFSCEHFLRSTRSAGR